MRYFILYLVLISFHSFAQSSIVAGSSDEMTLRDLQLTGRYDENASFTSRPLWVNKDSLFQSEINQLAGKNRQKKYFNAYPVEWEQRFNSHSYWGRNDGPMMSVKGYQTLIRGGFSANSKYIDLQLIPEIYWTPEASVKTFSLGQSALRFHVNKFPIGLSLSTESIWWGPGVFNSLMMSNNAPGFEHISLHTRSPLKTWIGNFEFQLISGNLQSESALPFENQQLNVFSSVFGRNPQDRYFNAINLTYSPRFLRGLSLGVNRMFQRYGGDGMKGGSFMQDYIPVLSSIFKNSAGGLDEDARARDQLINLFMRYSFPKANTEIYGEFGWNDHKYNIRDLTLNPDHAAAYLVGMRKIVPLSNQRRVGIEFELTQLEPTNSDIARPAGNWYVHGQIWEGYTNQNQIIGGGVTPGDNTATFRVTYSDGLRKQSITVERYQHDPRFHGIEWTDIAMSLKHQQPWKERFLFVAGLDFVNRKGLFWQDKNDVINLQLSLKTYYYW
ncbi:MAG: hypothetical protein RLZZ402_781 [Bacteroidota bacterium]|jgi:hypothetical protein